jgi:hypothetical protein
MHQQNKKLLSMLLYASIVDIAAAAMWLVRFRNCNHRLDICVPLQM